MSKRNSSTPSNTLFNYFTKTPPANKKTKSIGKDESASPVLDKPKDSKIELKKRERQSSPQDNASNSDEEAPVAPRRRKRIRLNVDSDDSDTENKADNVMETSAMDTSAMDTTVAETSKADVTLESKLGDSFKYTPSRKTPKQQKEAVEKLDDSTAKATTPKPKDQPQQSTPDEDNWVHCRLDFLKPENIRDANKRRPDHEDYEAKTLYVPPEFLKQQTPAHRQWWELKAAHYDCVLFFKVGKFYELYHMDAAVGVSELGFSYMKGEFAHSGFPESAYERMAATLVRKGYKIARVEQTETPDAMAERCRHLNRQPTKFDRVVRRELCQVAARGAEPAAPRAAAAAYMLAVAEEDHADRSTYGVCFVDTTLGVLHVGQFADDRHASRLLTTLARYPPALIIRSRRATPRTVRLLGGACPAARAEPAAPPDPARTLAVLAEKYYGAGDGGWPRGLTPHLDPGDALGLTPAKGSELAITALGFVVNYLTECLLDIQILSMGQFTTYIPPDILNETLCQEDKVESEETSSTLVLDAVTLKNLRIVQDEGCLYDRVNFCSSAFGKRLLYQWVCAPPGAPRDIRARQDAVRALLAAAEPAAAAAAALAALPDLERLLPVIHKLGNLNLSKHHPDSRAIFYEEKTYSKRKIQDFMSVLNGFETLLKLREILAGVDSDLLRDLLQFPPEGTFPDYRETLKFFQEAFDHEQARAEGRVLPTAGADAAHDAVLRDTERANAELQEYLVQQEKVFKCRLKYVGSDKKRFQLEVPAAAAARAGPGYQLEGARKGYKRFSTPETKELLARITALEERKAAVLKDLARRIFAEFSSHRAAWAAAAARAARVDALLALATYSRRLAGDACLPEFVLGAQPFLSITGGRHPCTDLPDFIPNDTTLGAAPGDESGAPTLLLTGPNMGGKSTLMRQVGLITVLAHLGSYVPAAACALTPVDRVFTRLGARDDLLAGRSTFLLEMSEAASIVRHATRRSLVLLDELGRGTSTYDGAALAAAVCAALASRGARLVFATHYHAAVAHLAAHPRVRTGHMACMVETDEAPDADSIPEETITFLYKLSPGSCPKSYGFNAARLAGVPRDVTRRALAVARGLEREAASARAFKRVLGGGKGVREVLRGLAV